MAQDVVKNNQEISFSELMGRNGVKIPPIQREYAQGREDAYAIRHGFVETLLKCGSGLVHLDFVYGVLDDTGMLVPLDGQQRLTTLLLFYWYFGAIEKSWKFVYDSRRMAMCFVEYLQDDDHKDYLSKPPNQRGKPSEWLKSHNGFVPAWESDSTVAGMLIMLDEIHSQANTLNTCLTLDELNQISFFFHQCDKAISTDETYLKINARGEALTEWENIKSILDSRANTLATTIQGATNDPVVLAARKWKNCINGDWTSCLESFLPEPSFLSEPDNNSLPAYIAVSIAMLNAAFRNVIDLAAAATINVSKLVDRTSKKQREEDGFSAAILGERIGAASVNNQEDLGRFYAEAFLHHTAIYSDYRDNLVWPDEAFVVVSNIFSSLKNVQQSSAVRFWPENRSQNEYWGGAGDATAFKQKFLFSSTAPTDASLDEDEKQVFSRISEKFRKTEYSGVRFSYSNALRMLAISRCADSPLGKFALSRCLNLLDSGCFNVTAEQFHKVNETLDEFQTKLAGGDMQAFSILPSDEEKLMLIVESERRKCALLFRMRDNGGDNVEQLSFWKIEKKLALMSGVVHFTFDDTSNDFIESRADQFIASCAPKDDSPNDSGYRALLQYMPDSPDEMKLLKQWSSFKDGFVSWRDFLFQKQVVSAFIRLCNKNSTIEPDWVGEFFRMDQITRGNFCRIARHWFCEHERVFACNTPQRIGPGCVCLTYTDEEKKLLYIANNQFLVKWSTEIIPLAENERLGIPKNCIMGENSKYILKISHRDSNGNWTHVSCFDGEFSSHKEKCEAIESFIKKVKKIRIGNLRKQLLTLLVFKTRQKILR